MRKSFIKPIFCLAVVCFTIPFFQAKADSKTINLKISHHIPTINAQHSKMLVPWARKIEELAAGKVKFTFYPGGALGNPRVQYDVLVKGVADIALIVHHYKTGVFPLTSVMRLPFMAENGKRGSAALWKIYSNYIKKEYKDVKVLWLYVSSPSQIHTTKKPVKTLEDLKGMKIRSMGKDVTDVLKLLGAVPVNMSIMDVYTALERGTVDGVAVPFEAMRAFKLFEVAKHSTVVNIFPVTFGILMNKKKWESLPPDVQKIIDENIGEKMFMKGGKILDDSDDSSRALCKKTGGKFYTLSEKELAKWKETVKPHMDKWTKTIESMGLPGKKVLAEALEMRK